VAESKIPQRMDVFVGYCLYDEVVRQTKLKEKSHAYLDHRNSARFMVAWLFRAEPLCWLPPFRQCRPRAARRRGHPRASKSVGHYLD